jgi:pantoate--beta-alanine ligase
VLVGWTTVQVIDNIAALRSVRQALTVRVGLVPTMGALHQGHMSLVEQSRAENDWVIVTIFVNPTQFARGEDLDKYPRNLPRDLDMLREVGVDVVFTPTTDLMYPAGYQTTVDVQTITQLLEGASRPEHFRGVTTIVAKLFNLTQPTTAYFGQKDAQQVVVIRRMAHDLNFPLSIAVCPTVREADGLAMSSRNVYLNPDQRNAATVLYRALKSAADVYAVGEREPEKLRQTACYMLANEPLVQPDYVSVADVNTLEELQISSESPVLLSLAVKLGATRLIDNCLLPFHLNNRADLSSTLGAS